MSALTRVAALRQALPTFFAMLENLYKISHRFTINSMAFTIDDSCFRWLEERIVEKTVFHCGCTVEASPQRIKFSDHLAPLEKWITVSQDTAFANYNVTYP